MERKCKHQYLCRRVPSAPCLLFTRRGMSEHNGLVLCHGGPSQLQKRYASAGRDKCIVSGARRPGARAPSRGRTVARRRTRLSSVHFSRRCAAARHRDHRPPIPACGVQRPARACPPPWRAGRTHHDPTGSPGRSPHSARFWPCPASPDRSCSARRPRPVAVCRSQPSFCLARPTICSTTCR
jgi:hypothetical protein